MNTIAPPDWLILFEDDTIYESKDGPWSQVAQVVMIDGLLVYETHAMVKEVHLLFPRRIEVLKPPTPRPCFAYKRMTMNLFDGEGKEPEWLYTCFGYLDDPSRVTLVASPQGCSTTSTLRSFPFTP